MNELEDLMDGCRLSETISNRLRKDYKRKMTYFRERAEKALANRKSAEIIQKFKDDNSVLECHD